MSTTRTVREIVRATPTLEGAGVRLHRVFGFGATELFDPFLLLDHFGSDDPADFIRGFPWHPHRGIETITYLLQGTAEHGDSLGNAGVIGPGDVQWMTAGSGIIHQEMPRPDAGGRMYGFQLWANLPREHKMMPPRYRDLRDADIPRVRRDDGSEIRIVAGEVDGQRGPMEEIVIDPLYLDVTLPAGVTFARATPTGHTVFAYAFAGAGEFGAGTEVAARQLALYGDGDEVRITAGAGGVRFLFVAGRPLREPVAWRGPIVMNTEAELEQAFAEYRAGTFIQHGEPE